MDIEINIPFPEEIYDFDTFELDDQLKKID